MHKGIPGQASKEVFVHVVVRDKAEEEVDSLVLEDKVDKPVAGHKGQRQTAWTRLRGASGAEQHRTERLDGRKVWPAHSDTNAGIGCHRLGPQVGRHRRASLEGCWDLPPGVAGNTAGVGAAHSAHWCRDGTADAGGFGEPEAGR